MQNQPQTSAARPQAIDTCRNDAHMKIAIVGSGETSHNDGLRCVIPLAQSYLSQTNANWYTIGTFKKGGIHQTAIRVAQAVGARAIQFHSVDAFFRWRPDEVFIFWNGRSNGCQEFARRCRSAGITYTLFCVNDHTVNLMGRVSGNGHDRRKS